jgi:hypothetical protein
MPVFLFGTALETDRRRLNEREREREIEREGGRERSAYKRA